MVSLEGLCDFVEEETSPTEEETNSYLETVALIKKKNIETAMLNLLDQIIDMSVGSKIGQAELENMILGTILFTFQQGDFMTEYIQAGITKKSADLCFQEDKNRCVITMRSPSLVEVVDKQTGTFDLFGLLIKYSSTNKRNRIVPEYITKCEPVEPKPRQTGKYSSFSGSHAIKRLLIPVIPTVQPPQQKVSNKFILAYNYFFEMCVLNVITNCINFCTTFMYFRKLGLEVFVVFVIYLD